jgi:hypothetical protein
VTGSSSLGLEISPDSSSVNSEESLVSTSSLC